MYDMKYLSSIYFGRDKMAIRVLLWDKPNNMDRYEKYMEEIGSSISIVTFKVEDMNSNKDIDKTSYDIFIADITSYKEEKIKYYEILRRINPYIQFLCIGNKSMAIDAWECGCTAYILKPITKEKLINGILRAIKQWEKEKLYYELHQVYMLKKGDKWIPLKYNEIIYFEKNGKKINVKTKKESYEFYSSFERLKKNIDMEYFFQCHQGYIVNRYKIKFINSDTLTLDGVETEIPVSRRIKKKLIDYS